MLRPLMALGAAILFLYTNVVAAAQLSSTWSMAGHDAQNSAFNNGEYVLGPNTAARLHVVWTVHGIAGAIATDQRVYGIVPNGTAVPHVAVFNTADGKMLLNLGPGRLRLSRFADDRPQALAHPDDTLLVASTRAVVALDPHNGARRWYTPGGATSMVVNGTTVYTGKSCSAVCGPLASYALDLRTGRRIWQHAGNYMHAPAVLNGALYVANDAGAGDTRVYTGRNGALLGVLRIHAQWFGDAHNAYALALPAVRPGEIPRVRSWVGSISPGGVMLWKADLGHVSTGNAVLAYGSIFAPSNRHTPGVIALNARTGKYQWGAAVGPSSNMVVANHLLYVLHSTTGTVDVLRTSNGVLLRRLIVGASPRGGETGLMVAGGTLYVLGANSLQALRP